MEIYTICGQLNNEKLIFCGGRQEFFGNLTSEALCKEKAKVGGGVCLGDFDGVHRGHTALFDMAKSVGRWGVLVFFQNSKKQPEITTLSEKLEIFEALGADYAVALEFSENFSKKTPEEFVLFLKNTVGADEVFAGFDYRFGYKASADANELINLCEKYNMSAHIMPAVTDAEEPIKSTRIRSLIESGDIKSANALLGRSYSISGIVETGFQNGKRLGFPTANISVPKNKLLPKDGVYSGRALGKKALINIGKNPTFDALNRTVEVHILDFDKELYGTEIKTEFLEKIRDDKKFPNLEALKERIKKDIEFVKER